MASTGSCRVQLRLAASSHRTDEEKRIERKPHKQIASVVMAQERQDRRSLDRQARQAAQENQPGGLSSSQS